MNGIQIRKARTEDLPAIQEIARRTIDKRYRPFLGNEGVDWYINSGESDRELETHMSNCDVLLRDGGILAFTIYFGDLIHLMIVDERIHRTGIGSLLLAHSESCLFATGKSVIRLETFQGNDQAINFYLKNGWAIARTEKDKEHGFTRVCFEKRARECERG